jgi:hypothetical protein
VEKIVKDAEYTVIGNEAAAQPEVPVLNMDDVGYAVIVGRYKSGKEFVKNININDLLLVKALLDFGVSYYEVIRDKHIIELLKEQ